MPVLVVCFVLFSHGRWGLYSSPQTPEARALTDSYLQPPIFLLEETILQMQNQVQGFTRSSCKGGKPMAGWGHGDAVTSDSIVSRLKNLNMTFWEALGCTLVGNLRIFHCWDTGYQGESHV